MLSHLCYSMDWKVKTPFMMREFWRSFSDPWLWRWFETFQTPTQMIWLQGWNPVSSGSVSPHDDTGTAWNPNLLSCQVNNAPRKGNRPLECGMSECTNTQASSSSCFIWVMPLHQNIFHILTRYFCSWHFLSKFAPTSRVQPCQAVPAPDCQTQPRCPNMSNSRIVTFQPARSFHKLKTSQAESTTLKTQHNTTPNLQTKWKIKCQELIMHRK